MTGEPDPVREERIRVVASEVICRDRGILERLGGSTLAEPLGWLDPEDLPAETQ